MQRLVASVMTTLLLILSTVNALAGAPPERGSIGFSDGVKERAVDQPYLRVDSASRYAQFDLVVPDAGNTRQLLAAGASASASTSSASGASSSSSSGTGSGSKFVTDCENGGRKSCERIITSSSFGTIERAKAHNNMGLIIAANTRIVDRGRAVAEFSKAIMLDSSFAEAYNNRGLTKTLINMMQLAGYADGIADLTTAIELDPNYALAYSNRGYALLLERHMRPAISDLDKAIDLDPSLAEAYKHRGHWFEMRGEFEVALVELNQSIRLDPRDHETYFLRSGIWRGLGRAKEAEQDLQTGRRLKSSK